MNWGPDKPVALWKHHAARRRSRLTRLRAWLSMAGFRDWVMMRTIPPGARILDVGCGGGRPVLAQIGEVTGLEPCADLAAISRKIYTRVAEAGAEAMPFADGEFDAVVSTDVIGHVPNGAKDTIFAEFFRVLRPGGVTIHVAETESDGWLARIARKEPEAYRQSWVEDVDHRNIESASVLLERFTKAGFVIEMASPIQAFIPECGTLGLMRRHKQLPFWLKGLGMVDRWLAKSEVVRELTCVLLTPLAMINRLARPEQGLGLLVVAGKPATNPACSASQRPSAL